jgi:hypothetical protein
MISQQRETLAHNPDSESASTGKRAIRESILMPIMLTAARQKELVNGPKGDFQNGKCGTTAAYRNRIVHQQ